MANAYTALFCHIICEDDSIVADATREWVGVVLSPGVETPG
jgi:hypothetical protein